MLKIYNSLTKTKQEFVPLEPNKVKMYACGITVSGPAHIGHGIQAMVFDIIRKYLEKKGYEVTYCRNYTDVDDKIIANAKKENIDPMILAKRNIEETDLSMHRLKVTDATKTLKATEHIEKIILFVQKLIDKGYAYVTERGDVYYSVEKFKGYGKLSNRNLEDAYSGVRIESEDNKQNPLDFALWKSAKEGEISWDSPWGKGRPGWHIECSCMAKNILGDTIDIHAGGSDLAFPHHENEIAQSEALTGKTFANYWLHSAFVNVNNQKMSKSLNNFLTARAALEKFDADVIRFLMLSAHYRQQLNFSEELLLSAKASVERIYNTIYNLENLLDEVRTTYITDEEKKYLQSLNKYKEKYIEKMDDDFNTADAITAIFDLIKDVNINVNIDSSKELITGCLNLIRELGKPLGMLQKSTKVNLDDEIQKLVNERQQARKDKNWALADKIRDDLKNRGIVLEDTPQGIRWHKIDE